MSSLNSTKLMNGTFGKLQFDGEDIAEILSFSAKIAISKDAVTFNGQVMEDSAITSAKGTMSMEMYHVNTRFVSDYLPSVLKGIEMRGSVIASQENKNTGAIEIVQYDGVSLDEFVLADWSNGAISKRTINATFTGYQLLSSISV